MTYFMLNPECYLVKGAKRGAVYNLHTGQIFSIDPELTVFLDACEHRKPFEEALKLVSSLPDEVKNVLNKLLKWRLGRFYETEKVAPIIEKLKPPMTKRQRREFNIPPQLGHLFIELTGKCNLNCIFCDGKSNYVIRMLGCKRWPAGKATKRGLELKDWIKIVGDAQKLGCRSLQFVGGEPLLLWDILFELIPLAKHIGYEHIRLDTNGVLLDDRKIRFLADQGVILLLQILSFKQEVHDKITRVGGSFEKLIHNLQKLRVNDAKYAFVLPIIRQNWDHWGETVEWFQSYDPEWIHHEILQPCRTENRDNVTDRLTHKLYYTTEVEKLQEKIEPWLFFQRCEGHPCWEGKLAVTCDGDVLPCPKAREEIIGDIHEKGLREIFRDEDMLRYWDMTKDNVEVCKDCEYRYACFDCRPFEKSASGKLKGKSPYCTYDPLKGKWAAIY